METYQYMKSAITHTPQGQLNIVALYNGQWNSTKREAMALRLCSHLGGIEQARNFVQSRMDDNADKNAKVEFGDIWFSYSTDSSGGSFGLAGAVIEQF